jgi:hypothetical protein
MKKFIFILFMLFPSLVKAEPTIVFNSEQHDFGNVKQGEPLEFTFEFSNAGPEELIIGKVNTFT